MALTPRVLYPNNLLAKKAPRTLTCTKFHKLIQNSLIAQWREMKRQTNNFLAPLKPDPDRRGVRK